MALIYILQVLLGFGFIIFIHEMGHFLAAKFVGIRVHAFSIGFPMPFVGKRFANIIHKKIGDTDYRIGWVPFGGYVQMEGQSDTPGKLGDAIKNDPGDYRNKSYWQKTLVLLGGVTMNAITAIIFFVLAFSVGVTFIEPTVGQVQPQSKAWVANEIKVGDKITHVNGRAVDDFEDVVYSGVFDGGDHIDVTVERKEGGKTVSKDVVVVLDADPTFGLNLPGIRAQHRVLITGEEAARFSESLGDDRPVDGDEIVAVGGRRLRNYDDFQGAMSISRGETVIRFKRGSNESAREWDVKYTPSRHFTSGSSSNVLGMYISSLPTVRVVRKGSAGERAGLKEGDRILAWQSDAGEKSFSSFGEFQDWLNSTQGKTRTLIVERDSKRTPLSVTADEKDSTPGRYELGVIMGDMKVPEEAEPVKILGVREGSASYKAGLRAGDKITGASVDGVDFYNPSGGFFTKLFGKAEEKFGLQAMGMALAAAYDADTRKAQDITFKIDRNGKSQTVKVSPDLNSEESVAAMVVSVAEQRSAPVTKGFIESIGAGFHHSKKVGYKIAMTLMGLFSGRISITHLGGPIVIAKRSYSLAGWGLGTLIFFLAFISLNLAIVNLIPIPILDGGQWLLVSIEAASGRPVPDKLLNPIMTVSFFLVVGLMLFVLGNDIVTVFVKKWV
jgi:regulator of sigma E protease